MLCPGKQAFLAMASGAFPGGPMVRLHLPIQGLQIGFLVRELRFSNPHGQKNQNIKQKQYCIFPTQGSNPGLLHHRWILYSLSHQESPIKTLKMKVKVTQSCPTLCNPMDYRVHGILQARILEWIAFPFSRGSSWPGDPTQVSHIAGRFFTSRATREAQEYWGG